MDAFAAVDERQGIAVQGLHDELDADEAQHHGQAGRQVDELVEQSTQQEVQLLQAEQCEHVGGEHQERILGQAEDRGNRVESEHDVGGADGQEHDEHRGPVTHAVLGGAQLLAVVVVGNLDDLAQITDDAVLVIFLIFIAAEHQFDGGVDQEGTEQEEHPREAGDQGRADQNENATENQSNGDADG